MKDVRVLAAMLRRRAHLLLAVAATLVLGGIVGWLLRDRVHGIGWAVLIALSALAVGLLLGWLLWPLGAADRTEDVPPPTIPSRLDEPQLAARLGERLAGHPADGSRAAAGPRPDKVVWVKDGDEVVAHLDSIEVRILEGLLLVSIDLESVETGRSSLVVPFAVGGSGDDAGLVVVTEDLPRGNGLLAARWGAEVQAAVWSSLLGIATAHADERAAAPRGLTVGAGLLHFEAGPGLRAHDPAVG